MISARNVDIAETGRASRGMACKKKPFKKLIS